MSDEDYLCPVCGQHYFDSFDDFDSCPNCGWEINVPQFADHDLADGRNALSVNEQKVQYAVMQIPALKDTLKTMKRQFLKDRWDIKELMREFSTGSSAEDFEAALPMFIEGRKNYIDQLQALMQTVK